MDSGCGSGEGGEMLRIKTFNDALAVLMSVVVFPGLWIAHGGHWITLPSEAMGATVVLETLIIQFYFRRAPNNEVK